MELLLQQARGHSSVQASGAGSSQRPDTPPAAQPGGVTDSAQSGYRVPREPFATRDAPAVLEHTRASRFAALAATSDREASLEELRRDYSAASSRSSVDAHFATWSAFHTSWFGQHVPVLPITPETLEAVSSMFKRGRYRSFPNYLSTAKAAHIAENHAWSQRLEQTARKCTRSVLRGLGAGKQSLGLSVSQLWQAAAVGGFTKPSLLPLFAHMGSIP